MYVTRSSASRSIVGLATSTGHLRNRKTPLVLPVELMSISMMACMGVVGTGEPSRPTGRLTLAMESQIQGNEQAVDMGLKHPHLQTFCHRLENISAGSPVAFRYIPSLLTRLQQQASKDSATHLHLLPLARHHLVQASSHYHHDAEPGATDPAVRLIHGLRPKTPRACLSMTV